MAKNPLVKNIRAHLPHLTPMPPILPFEELRLEQILDAETAVLHPPHREFKATRDRGARLQPARRRSTRLIPCEDAPQPTPYGKELATLGAALQEIVTHYYPAVGETLPLPPTRRATPRNLMRLLKPLRTRLPQGSATTREWAETLTFREYFEGVFDDNGKMPVPFPAGAYRTLRKLYPYKHTLPDYGGNESDTLRRSLAAVWDFYQLEKLADPSLLELPLRAIADFLDPLSREMSGFYPTEIYLDGMIQDEEAFWEESGELSLEFPSIHGDSEESSCYIAFLEGPESVAAHVQMIWELVREGEEGDLDPEDAALIAQEGILRLVTHYAATDVGRKVPLNRLANCWEEFFGEWTQRYPEAEIQGWWPDIITWSDQCFTPRCGRDIQLLRDYGHAFQNMLTVIPYITEDAFNDNDLLSFLGDLCRVYRLGDTAATLPEEDADAA